MVVYESVRRDQGFLVKTDTQIMRAEVADPGHSSITTQLFIQELMLGYFSCREIYAESHEKIRWHVVVGSTMYTIRFAMRWREKPAKIIVVSGIITTESLILPWQSSSTSPKYYDSPAHYIRDDGLPTTRCAFAGSGDAVRTRWCVPSSEFH